MHILFAIKSLSPPPGGAERVLATVASQLAERGHRVVVASFDDPRSRDFYPISEEVERIRLGKLSAGRSRAGDMLARVRMLRRICAETKPDVAVGFMHSSFLPLAVALLGSRTPLVASERTSYRHYKRHRLERLLLHLSLPLIDRMTANGDGIREGFPKRFRSRMVVIPNPVERVTRLADPFRNPKILLTVGAFRPEKDHDTLIRAFAKIHASRSDWRLRLVGDGPLRVELERLVQDLRLQKSVRFVGVIRSVEAEYLRAQLFVLPSAYEAFPNVLAEALAHGLPSVGFADCPGTNQLIQEGVNGILANAGDRVESLATALESLMSSPELRQTMGSAAVGSVAHYSLHGVIDAWESLLQSVIPKTGPSPAFGRLS